MSFQQGLSGLSAASKGLDVIGHNIANANTTGMKGGRAEFAALYSSSLGYGGGSGSGIGVAVGAVSQQFSQGSLSITGNDLDLAVNGSGFFRLSQPDNSVSYTRDGTFQLDKNGYLVSSGGANLMGFNVDPTTGARASSDTVKLRLPTGAESPPKKTGLVTMEMNFPASAPIVSPVPTPAPTTYGTSFTAYDPQGNKMEVGLSFVKTAANTWDAYQSVGGSAPVSLNTSLVFEANTVAANPSATPPVVAAQAGKLTPASLTALAALTLSVPSAQNPGGGPVLIKFNPQDIENTFTQYNNNFSNTKLTQDGYTSGSLTGLKIEDSGVITARYSNGQTQSAGQVALANFANVQGLAPTGGNAWVETFQSGQPLLGGPGEGKLGKLRSGALEESNVDLTAELVNMMTAQRSYQANAQTIKTQDQVMSTLVNLR